MPWYRTGTVSCTQNSTTVTGAGTAFVANARVGDAFNGPDGRWYEVVNIASATAVSIQPGYLGPTISGGAFAIAPVQGYPKMLADQFRAIADDLGPVVNSSSVKALAAVTGSADRIAYFTAAEQMALATLTASGRTLLAQPTVAAQRSALGLGSAALAAITGTVSQSGGAPTGAIIESGVLNSGYYTKFADGTLIQRRSVSIGGGTVANGSVFRSLSYDMGPMPVPFVGDYLVTGYGISQSSGGGWAGQQVFGTSSTWGQWSAYTSSAVSGSITIGLVGVGRWF